MSQAVETKPPRGRPRPQEAIQRDEQILSLLKDGSKTRNELCELTGMDTSLMYLSLSRLRRQGRVKLAEGSPGKRQWSVT